MKKSYPYLSDIRFLQEIINNINTVYYVKINILNWDEQVIRDITGKVTNSLSINIDGKSAVRRTANISFLIEENDADVTSLLELNKKIYLQIGQKNPSLKYSAFPILWFPMGLFIITGISFSHNLSNITATLNLKDKMCLLNGQCGGVLPAATVFDNYEMQDDNGQINIIRPTIYQIITELVNHFGGQQLGRIIISDIDTRIKQTMEWNGPVPLYVLKGSSQGGYYFTTSGQDDIAKAGAGYVRQKGSPFEAGSNVGFILTDFSYPGDLIGNPGDTVVTILDKIKNTLGNYEYFYDVQGNFRFQEIKNYLNNSQSKYILECLGNINREPSIFVPEYLQFKSIGEAYLLQRTNGKAVFSFKKNNNVVTSYSNTPQIQNIKNDYIIWGLRKSGGSNNDYPIRYHLAIDSKPQIGNTYKVVKYVDLQDESLEKWYKPLKFMGDNTKGIFGVIYYDESNNKYYIWKKENNLSKYVEISDAQIFTITTKDWRTELYLQGVIAEPTGVDSNFYYPELKAEWPKIYDIQHGKFRDEIFDNTMNMDYYLDFINPVTEKLKRISVENIGRRTQILNKNSDVNCVFEPYIPDVVLIKLDYSTEPNSQQTDMKKLREECEERSLNYCQVNEDIYDYLVPGRLLNSGYQEVKQVFNQYINYSENISLQTLPIFFLEPNTCIEIQDKDTQISGNYMINSLSISLDSLSINANKVISRNM